MSSLEDQIEYSEQELREMHADRLWRERRDRAKIPAVLLVLERVEKQLIELNVTMSEVARILRTD